MSRIPLSDEVVELDEFEPDETSYREFTLSADDYEEEYDDEAEHEEGLLYEQERY